MDSFVMDSSGTRIAVWGAVLAGLTFLACAAYLAKPPTLTVSGDSLVIRNSLFGREIAGETIRFDETRVIDLARESELQPKWRTMGVGIFKYRTGWFRLRNGEKALAFLGSGKDVLYAPTNSGYVLMFDTADAETLLSKVKLLHRK